MDSTAGTHATGPLARAGRTQGGHTAHKGRGHGDRPLGQTHDGQSSSLHWPIQKFGKRNRWEFPLYKCFWANNYGAHVPDTGCG